MSTFGALLNNITKEERALFRQLEQTKKKIVKCRYALAFNTQCIKENVLPNYTNIKAKDPAVRAKSFTKEYQRNLVVHEIEKKKDELKELNSKLTSLQEKVSRCDQCQLSELY